MAKTRSTTAVADRSGSASEDGNARALPPGWRMVRFDEIAQSIGDRVEPGDADTEYYVGLEHLDTDSLKIRRWGNPAEVEATKLRFRAGDIIFGKRRVYQRKLAVAEFDGICSAHAMVIRANADEVYKNFLPFFMRSDLFLERALAISVGSLSPTINWSTLARQTFPFPPKNEQQRMAELLWSAHDVCVRQEEVSNAARLLLMSLSDRNFPDLSVSHAMDAHEREVLHVGDVATLQSGYPFQSAAFSDHGDRLLRCSNVGVNCLNWQPEETRYWPSERRGDVEDYVLAAGDIVIAMDRPFVGEGFKIARVTDSDLPALLLQRVGRFRVTERILSEYLWAFLHSNSFRSQLRRVQQGTDLPHISRFDIEGTRLPVPDLARQRTVVAQFQSVEVARDLAEGHLFQTHTLLKQMGEKLIRGAATHVQ